MKTSQYDYFLPAELIAQYPSAERGESKLLVANLETKALTDTVFSNILDLIGDSYFLVMNDTKVVPARMPAKKETGGNREVFFLSLIDEYNFNALIRGKIYEGTKLFLGEHTLVTGKRLSDGSVNIKSPIPVLALMQLHGEIPLPPYINRGVEKEDTSRYQTVYSNNDGSVAAPTAGLHFTKELLKKLENKGVECVKITLHVGLGTFRPIQTDLIEEHKMHKEHYFIPSASAEKINKLKKQGKKLLSIGTTSTRALESASIDKGVVKAGESDTNLFIHPGYEFKVVDAMLTNFHLPSSSLLVLLSALMGLEYMKEAYMHAISKKYMFYSYGDAMLIY